MMRIAVVGVVVFGAIATPAWSSQATVKHVVPACHSERTIDRLAGLLGTGQRDEFANAAAIATFSGECVLLEKGDSVYVYRRGGIFSSSCVALSIDQKCLYTLPSALEY